MSADVVISPTGVQGPRGNTILSGVGAPTAATGVDGDYYGDTTNLPTSWVLHGPKATGAWPAGTITVSGGGVQLAGDLGGSNSSPQVTSTHLVAPLPIPQGGTGGTSQASAQTALGLGSAATQPSSAFDAAGAASTAEAAAIADAATKYQKLQPWLFDVTASAYGAKGDGQFVLDGAMGTGSAVLTSASGKFTSGDVGKLVMVYGAATAAVTNLVTTIASFQSATQVTLAAANASGGSISGALVLWASDDTAHIQAAINAALAYATTYGSAKVRIPTGSGLFYGIGGALVTGGSTKGNSQLTLGAPVATSANKLVLDIEGAANGAGLQHWQQNSPQFNGSTLVSFGVFANSTAQSNSITANGNPAVIGGPAQPGGYGAGTAVFSNMLVTLRNLSILTTHSANGLTYSAADFSGIAEANLENFAYGTTGTVAGGSYTTPVAFGNGLSIGLLMPAAGNNDNNRAANVSCHGGYTFGIFATEHFVCDRLCILYCWSGLCPVGSYFGSVGATHAITIGQASIEACTNVVNIIGVGSSGIGPWIFANIDTEISGPTFTDRTSGTGLNAALGTITLTGLYTPANVNATAATGLNIINGQQGSPAHVISGTAAYTVNVTDRTLLVDASAQNTVINLLSSAWTPQVLTIVRLDNSGHTLTITANGAELINGAASITLGSQYAKATLTPARVSSTWGWYQTA